MLQSVFVLAKENVIKDWAVNPMTRAAFTNMDFTLIQAISYHIQYKIWDEITYPFPNFDVGYWSLIPTVWLRTTDWNAVLDCSIKNSVENFRRDPWSNLLIEDLNKWHHLVPRGLLSVAGMLELRYWPMWQFARIDSHLCQSASMETKWCYTLDCYAYYDTNACPYTEAVRRTYWSSIWRTHFPLILSQSCRALANGPLVRYLKLRFAHAPGMPGTFSPPPTSKETAS